MENKNTNDYIDLLAICGRFFRFVKVFWPAILLLSLILTCTFSAVSLKPQTRTYSTHIIFTYGIKNSNSTEFSYSLSGLSRALDVDRVSTAIESILVTDMFKDALKKRLDTNKIRTSLEVSFTGGTNLGILSSVSSDEEEAVEILAATFDVLPDVLRFVTGPLEFHMQGTPDEVKETVEGIPVAPLAAAGFFVGAFLGLGILALAAFTRKELRSEADVFQALSLKTYGKLPFLNQKRSIPLLGVLRSRGFLPRRTMKDNTELIVTTSYQENLRLISTQIIEDLRKNQFRSLLIMSTKKSEGKTLFAKGLKEELIDAGWDVSLIENYEEYRTVSEDLSDDKLLLLDFPGSTTSDMEIMETAEAADASLLIIKSDEVLPQDAKWGMHFLRNCKAVCIGAVLNACI